MELSIVMPCLNEAETLATCIRKARACMQRLGVDGEVVVADNGSSDGSQALAESEGARVVSVAERGYGSALRGGVAAARGRYVIMGDADDSYDFSALDAFLERLRAGDELVMGNRFRGGIQPEAMPFLHRYVGNPVLTAIGRLFFRCPAGDFHCGLRGFGKEAYDRLGLQTTGMEFASEMVIAATLRGLRISEVPTVLSKDGRTRPPHLRTWRDGWRHLRFMLLYSPQWLFLVPGLLLFLGGLVPGLWLLAGPRRVAGVELDIHTLLVSGFSVLLGFQVVVFGLFTRIYATVEGFLPEPPGFVGLFRFLNLERGLSAGLAATLAGMALLGLAIASWSGAGYGPLDPRHTMRQVIPAAVLTVIGVETIFASFFFSTLGLARRRAV